MQYVYASFILRQITENYLSPYLTVFDRNIKQITFRLHMIWLITSTWGYPQALLSFYKIICLI